MVVMQLVVVCGLTYRDLLSQRRRGVSKVQRANKMQPAAGGSATQTVKLSAAASVLVSSYPCCVCNEKCTYLRSTSHPGGALGTPPPAGTS